MNLLLTIRVALRALRKNKMRASLTVLGVVIGIAAVTTMVSIGQSASGLVQGQFEMLGTNVILIFPGAQHRGGVRQGRITTLTAEDSVAINEECPAVLAASPLVGTGGQVIFGHSNWSPKEMHGVDPNYLLVRNWQTPTRRLLYRPRRHCICQGLRHRSHGDDQALSNSESVGRDDSHPQHPLPCRGRIGPKRCPTWWAKIRTTSS